jgi:hypothetical protein
MRRKYKTARIFFILSLFTALVSLPASAAVSRGKLERSVTAWIAGDENGIISISGFSDKTYEMNGSYRMVGSIQNKSNSTISLKVRVKPDYTNEHLYTRLGIRIGSDSYEFRYGTEERQFLVSLTPGQTVEVRAFMILNFFQVLPVDFEFEATDAGGSLQIELGETYGAPRRIYLY